MPEIMGALKPEPEARAIAAEASETDRHVGRDAAALGEDAMQGLARDAKLPRRLGDAKTERRQNVFAQDRAGMGRHSRRLAINLNFLCSSHVRSFDN
jgi:hypothetical protein